MFIFYFNFYFILILFFLFFKIYLFIYFWLLWVFVAACSLSVVAESGSYSSLRCAGFSLWWLPLLQSTGSRHMGFSSCGSQAVERRLSSCGARRGLVAPRHVGSSRSRAWTHVPCVGRQTLNHCATGEALYFTLNCKHWLSIDKSTKNTHYFFHFCNFYLIFFQYVIYEDIKGRFR